MSLEARENKQELLARELLLEITRSIFSNPAAYNAMAALAKAESRTFAQELTYQAKMIAGTFYVPQTTE